MLLLSTKTVQFIAFVSNISLLSALFDSVVSEFVQNVDTVMSETRLPVIGAVIMTLEAGRPTIVKEQVCLCFVSTFSSFSFCRII